MQGFAGFLLGLCEEGECGASQGKSKLAPPESSIPGCHKLASRRCCGAKPKFVTSAPQKRGRLAGFREASGLYQEMISWNCGASQGKSKLAPPESSTPGCHRLASAPLLRRKTQVCHFCAAKERQIGRIQRSSLPSSRNDFLELRRQPGKKQVGAAGKFNSGVPQACLSAAGAAPNSDMPHLRRMQKKHLLLRILFNACRAIIGSYFISLST